jgi:tetratricopeptide (TPR) repeat protein
MDAAVAPKAPPALVSTNAAFLRALQILLQTNATLQAKMAVWQDLRANGQLDDALSCLKDAAANNPGDAAYPTALAEGYYAKLQSVYGQAGSSAVAMLALQTDQSFNDALQINPSSWEAQYVKADALSHWPAEMNKGPEVIQQLSSLIDQQDGQSAQSQFAQSYVLLGDEYQKLGQSDFASATWQLGLQKYPGNETLQQRVKGRSN